MRRRGAPRKSILKVHEDSHTESEKPNAHGSTLVSRADIDFMKQGFNNFDRQKKGQLEFFELAIFLNSKLSLSPPSDRYAFGRRENRGGEAET